MRDDKYDFLASPYYSPDAGVREWRFEMACRAAAYLYAQGRSVFAPIVQGHPVAERHTLPLRAADWWVANLPFLRHSSRLLIAQIPGWEESEGIALEKKEAMRCGITIAYLPFDLFKDL